MGARYSNGKVHDLADHFYTGHFGPFTGFFSLDVIFNTVTTRILDNQITSDIWTFCVRYSNGRGIQILGQYSNGGLFDTILDPQTPNNGILGFN